jgi:hypothetical protein
MLFTATVSLLVGCGGRTDFPLESEPLPSPVGPIAPVVDRPDAAPDLGTPIDPQPVPVPTPAVCLHGCADGETWVYLPAAGCSSMTMCVRLAASCPNHTRYRYCSCDPASTESIYAVCSESGGTFTLTQATPCSR